LRASLMTAATRSGLNVSLLAPPPAPWPPGLSQRVPAAAQGFKFSNWGLALFLGSNLGSEVFFDLGLKKLRV